MVLIQSLLGHHGQDASPGCSHLKAGLGLEGPLTRRPACMAAGQRPWVSVYRPRLKLLECPLAWQLAPSGVSDLERTRQSCPVFHSPAPGATSVISTQPVSHRAVSFNVGRCECQGARVIGGPLGHWLADDPLALSPLLASY